MLAHPRKHLAPSTGTKMVRGAYSAAILGLAMLPLTGHEAEAQRGARSFAPGKRMSPTQRSAARLKNLPPKNWIRHYLGDDRYKIAGGVWKFVTTPNDTYYYRPGYLAMLQMAQKRPANNIIGFVSQEDASDAGYMPHFSAYDQSYGYLGEKSNTRFPDPTVLATLSEHDSRWYGKPDDEESTRAFGNLLLRSKVERSNTGSITLSDGVSELATGTVTTTTRTTVNTAAAPPTAATSTTSQTAAFLRSVVWKNRVGAYKVSIDIMQPYAGTIYNGNWDPDMPPVAGPLTWITGDYVLVACLELPRNYKITPLLNPKTFGAAYDRLRARREMVALLKNVEGGFPGGLGNLQVKRTVIGGWPGVRLLPAQAQAAGGAGAPGGAAPAGGAPAAAPAGGAAPAAGGAQAGAGGAGGGSQGAHSSQGDTGVPIGANIWIVGNPDANPPKIAIITSQGNGSTLLNSLNLQPTRGLRPVTAGSIYKSIGD